MPDRAPSSPPKTAALLAIGFALEVYIRFAALSRAAIFIARRTDLQPSADIDEIIRRH